VFQIPWWALLLILVAFALAGVATALFLTARTGLFDGRRRRWYDERKIAYVDLLAIFERNTYRLRAAYDAGDKPDTWDKPGEGLGYVDEVGPALMQVRLLASGPVRSAALAVHLLLQKLHGEMNPAAVSGVQPQIHFRELLAQVPLVMQQFEAAIREELSIDPLPPVGVAWLNGHLRGREPAPWRRRPAREPALDDGADNGQDRSRD
jgi:hypothetical protein